MEVINNNNNSLINSSSHSRTKQPVQNHRPTKTVSKVGVEILGQPAYSETRKDLATDLHPINGGAAFKTFYDEQMRPAMLNEQFLIDLTRAEKDLFFEKPHSQQYSFLERYLKGAWDNKYTKMDFKKNKNKKEEDIAVEQAVTFLRNLGLNGTEIAELSQSFHQGAAAESLTFAFQKYPGFILSKPVKEELPVLPTGHSTDRLWKVGKEKDETVFSQQTLIRMIHGDADIEDLDADEMFYLMATTKVNMATGVGTVSISTPSKTPLSFDFS